MFFVVEHFGSLPNGWYFAAVLVFDDQQFVGVRVVSGQVPCFRVLRRTRRGRPGSTDVGYSTDLIGRCLHLIDLFHEGFRSKRLLENLLSSWLSWLDRLCCLCECHRRHGLLHWCWRRQRIAGLGLAVAVFNHDVWGRSSRGSRHAWSTAKDRCVLLQCGRLIAHHRTVAAARLLQVLVITHVTASSISGTTVTGTLGLVGLGLHIAVLPRLWTRPLTTLAQRSDLLADLVEVLHRRICCTNQLHWQVGLQCRELSQVHCTGHLHHTWDRVLDCRFQIWLQVPNGWLGILLLSELLKRSSLLKAVEKS